MSDLRGVDLASKQVAGSADHVSQARCPGVARAYSVTLACLPILWLYASPLPHVNLAEFVLFFFVAVAFPKVVSTRGHASRAEFRIGTLLLVLGLAAASALGLLLIDLTPSMTDVVARFAKVLLWAVVTSFVSGVFFLPSLTIRWMQIVAFIGACYLICQYTAWKMFSLFLPPVFDQELFPPLQASYRDSAALIAHYNYFFVRPASFFGEPAYFCYYALIVIALLLVFSPKSLRTHQWALLIVLSLAVILSTSTTGICLLAAVWGFWIVNGAGSRRAARIPLPVALLGLVGTGMTAILWRLRGSDQGVFQSTGSALEKLAGWTSTSRLGGSYELYFQLDSVRRIVGVGLGNEDIYLGYDGFYNDIVLVALSAGLVGLLLLVVYWYWLYSRAVPGTRILVVLYTVVSFGEQFLYSSFSYVILAFVLYGLRSCEEGGRYSPKIPKSSHSELIPVHGVKA